MSDRELIAGRLRSEIMDRSSGIWASLGDAGSLRDSLPAIRELGELCRLADLIGGAAAIPAKRGRPRKVQKALDDMQALGEIGVDGEIPGHRE